MARVINGYPFASSAFNRDNGWPIVRIRDVVPGRSETFYSGEVPDGFWLQDGDLLVGMDGDFNIGKWKGGRALLNQRVCKVVPDPEQIVPDFLFYLLPGYLKLINEHTSSTTVKHLSSRTLGAIPLPVPPLEAQRRIVARIDELFDELDDGEASLSRARDDLETYRKSLLKAAVTGELTADWRAANPAQETGTQLLQRILADRKARWEAEPKNRGRRYTEPLRHGDLVLPPLPDGWTWASLDQLIAGLRNGLSQKPNPTPPGLPMLRISAVREMLVRQDDVRWLPESFDTTGFLVFPGDLLFTRYNGSPDLVGVCGRYRGPEPVAYPDKLMRATPAFANDDLFEYLEIAMNCGATRKYVESFTKTSAGQHGVSGETVKTAPVPLPPEAEMSEIVRRIRNAMSERTEAQQCYELVAGKTAPLRQAILNTAFRGELVQ